MPIARQGQVCLHVQAYHTYTHTHTFHPSTPPPLHPSTPPPLHQPTPIPHPHPVHRSAASRPGWPTLAMACGCMGRGCSHLCHRVHVGQCQEGALGLSATGVCVKVIMVWRCVCAGGGGGPAPRGGTQFTMEWGTDKTAPQFDVPCCMDQLVPCC
jgi:hypothetical protein